MRRGAVAIVLVILLVGTLSAGYFGVFRQTIAARGEVPTAMRVASPDGNTTCILLGCGLSSCWNQPLCPVTVQCATLSSNPAAIVTYSSNSTTAITAVAYAVVINYLGELIYATTSSFTVAPNSTTTTAYLLIEGLPPGNYTTDVFSLSPSTGLVISPTVTLTCPSVQVSFPLGTSTLMLAQPLVFCPGVLVAPCPPNYIQDNLLPFVQSNFRNNADVEVNATVFLVILNNASQTVYYTTSLLVLPPGQNQTLDSVIFYLPDWKGVYTASVYALSPGGTVLSETYGLNFTL